MKMKKVRLVFVIVSVVLFEGCASTTYDLKVDPSKMTNNGQPFYILIKNNSPSNYLASNYETVYQDFTDDKVSQKLLVYPQKGVQTWQIKRANDRGMSFYFLFQNMPNSVNWKLYLTPYDQRDLSVTISRNDNIQRQP